MSLLETGSTTSSLLILSLSLFYLCYFTRVCLIVMPGDFCKKLGMHILIKPKQVISLNLIVRVYTVFLHIITFVAYILLPVFG